MPNPNSSLLSRPTAVLLLATFCCLLWGSAYPAIKHGYAMFGIARHDVASQMVFAGVRFVAAGLLLLLASLVMGWGGAHQTPGLDQRRGSGPEPDSTAIHLLLYRRGQRDRHQKLDHEHHRHVLFGAAGAFYLSQ